MEKPGRRRRGRGRGEYIPALFGEWQKCDLRLADERELPARNAKLSGDFDEFVNLRGP